MARLVLLVDIFGLVLAWARFVLIGNVILIEAAWLGVDRVGTSEGML